MLDNLDDAFSVANGAKNFSGSIATCLQSVGQPMPFGRDGVPILEVSTIIEAMRQHLGGTHDYALHCPRAAPSVGVVACTYHHWFRPFSRHCQLPVSGRRMQRFLQYLGRALINCQSFSGVLLGVSMLPEPIGSAHIEVVWLLQMNCT